MKLVFLIYIFWILFSIQIFNASDTLQQNPRDFLLQCLHQPFDHWACIQETIYSPEQCSLFMCMTLACVVVCTWASMLVLCRRCASTQHFTDETAVCRLLFRSDKCSTKTWAASPSVVVKQHGTPHMHNLQDDDCYTGSRCVKTWYISPM